MACFHSTPIFFSSFLFIFALSTVQAYTGTFWVVTDIHAADDYVSGTDPTTFCTQGTGVAGRFMSYVASQVTKLGLVTITATPLLMI